MFVGGAVAVAAGVLGHAEEVCVHGCVQDSCESAGNNGSSRHAPNQALAPINHHMSSSESCTAWELYSNNEI